MHRTQRVMAYVDGLNLHHGIRHARLDRFLWLDIPKLASSLLREGQRLVGTKYFVARFSARHGRAAAHRQSAHLRALQTIQGLETIEGRFRTHLDECRECGFGRSRHEEKMTDVNIAVELVLDAEDDRYDVALLITAYADLTGPIRRLRKRHPNKRFLVAFPPRRASSDLKNAAHGFVRVDRATIRASQLPYRVAIADGGMVTRPAKWSAK